MVAEKSKATPTLRDKALSFAILLIAFVAVNRVIGFFVPLWQRSLLDDAEIGSISAVLMVWFFPPFQNVWNNLRRRFGS